MQHLKLQQLIKPNFGTISICGCSLGDSRKENLLDSYDKDGTTRVDRNFNLYANLQLGELGFSGGFIRLEYDTQDKLSHVVLTTSYNVPYPKRLSYIHILIDYLHDSEYFDTILEESSFCFRNALNELLIQFYDQEIVVELFPSHASGKEPGPNFESGASKTVTMLSLGIKDEWDDYYEKKRYEEVLAYNGIKKPVRPALHSESKEEEEAIALINKSKEAQDAQSVWMKFIELVYHNKPRLYSLLKNATIIQFDNEGSYKVIIAVMNEAQKQWIKERVLQELTDNLKNLTFFSTKHVTCEVFISQK